MPEKFNIDAWNRDAEYLADRGRLCAMWGLKASDMNPKQLLAFVGFLDEVIEVEREKHMPESRS